MYKQILVKSLSNLPVFINSTLISNEHSLYNPFNNVTIMDTREIISWLNEYEILIIGNYFKKGCITETFINQLAQKKTAAIITKKKFEPYISSKILAACDRYNIAIIICEDHYSWSKIQAPILELITHRQLSYLKENNDFYQIVIKSINQTDTSNKFCNNIYHVADLSLAILNQDYSFIDYSENMTWEIFLQSFRPQQKQVIGSLSNQQAIFGYVHTNASLAEVGLKVFVYPFIGFNNKPQFLLLAAPHYIRQLETRIMDKINTIISIFTLRSAFQRQNLKTNFFSINLTFQQLITAELSQDKEKHLKAMLESKKDATYYLMICTNSLQTDTEQDPYSINNKYVDFYEFFEEKNQYPKTIYFFTKDNSLAFLIEDSPNPIDYLIDYLQELVESYFATDCFKVGVSKAHSLKNTFKGWREAKDAVSYLLNSNSKNKLKKYQDLGILSIFINNKGDLNQKFCSEMIEAYITPLKTHDKKNHTDLLNTVIVFFTMDCSYKKTSDFLYIHVNTLRSRINNIEKLINIDINHTEDKFNLFTALKVYESEIV